MQDAAICSAKQYFKQVVLEHLDVDRLDDHIIQRTTFTILEVSRREHVYPVDIVTVPVVIEELSLAD